MTQDDVTVLYNRVHVAMTALELGRITTAQYALRQMEMQLVRTQPSLGILPEGLRGSTSP